MSNVRISHELRIQASAQRVWTVLSTPSRQSSIDPRVRVVEERGEPGTVGSCYVVAARGRPPMSATVTEAVPGTSHVVTLDWNGRTRGLQEARLRPDGQGCVLTYAMEVDVPLGLRWLQRVYGTRQLVRWLDAVARVSTSTDDAAD